MSCLDNAHRTARRALGERALLGKGQNVAAPQVITSAVTTAPVRRPSVPACYEVRPPPD
ncbi:hypothetical protein [Streptomyces jumonjinensis]|uniref:hypothetical protein n=1 Tax=Streptomyces jumonjinensis TaxID=1945 RepID=UPI0037B77990